jgi:hypothetical protein
MLHSGPGYGESNASAAGPTARRWAWLLTEVGVPFSWLRHSIILMKN